MKGSIGHSQKAAIVRSAATMLVLALVASGLISTSVAFANTSSSPTIVFDGNTLATTTPRDELGSRLETDLLGLSPVPLSRVVSTNRDGYTFGGWSLEKGGEATKELTTTRTSDTFRVIYAVWNTTIRYKANGADSGALTNFKTQDVYRFGQNLVLPTKGTLAKSRYDFGGWMPAPYSSTRITSYQAGSTDVGNQIMYAAWIKSVSFDANGATGTVPASVVYTSGGPRLKLPAFKDTTLRKPGYNLAGWSTSPAGSLIRNPASFVPLLAQNTLYAIWKVQGTEATSEIAFKPGKSKLRASQKRILDNLASSIGLGTAVKVDVASLRAAGTAKSLGKARNRAVVKYLRSVGIEAALARTNSVATSGTSKSSVNNRVTVAATWTNPAN